MTKGSSIGGSVALGGVLVALVLRATTLHSVNGAPLVYRVVSNVNDLDAVEGLAPPGRAVELWVKQRNFKEGTDDASDPFAWCGWKNGGDAVRIGIATADAKGVWRLSDLRHAGTTVMLFPPAPGGDRCLGGLYTELLPRACDQPGVNCSAWDAPTLHWLNVRKLRPKPKPHPSPGRLPQTRKLPTANTRAFREEMAALPPREQARPASAAAPPWPRGLRRWLPDR